jgi:hypothetical protein
MCEPTKGRVLEAEKIITEQLIIRNAEGINRIMLAVRNGVPEVTFCDLGGNPACFISASVTPTVCEVSIKHAVSEEGATVCVYPEKRGKMHRK